MRNDFRYVDQTGIAWILTVVSIDDDRLTVETVKDGLTVVLRPTKEQLAKMIGSYAILAIDGGTTVKGINAKLQNSRRD